MRDAPLPFDVEGPVRAEVFVIALRPGDASVVLSGPCGAAPWLIETGDAEHPMATVDRMAADLLAPVHVAHSTSWRHVDGAVILSFVVVVGHEAVEGLEQVVVPRADLARGTAHTAPTGIGWAQVLEHGLRHLVWLHADDEQVRDALPDGWRVILQTYVPEPFRMLEVRR